MITVKRIDLTSAFKVGMLVSALYAGVLGLCYLLLVASVLPSLNIVTNDPNLRGSVVIPNALVGASLATCCIFYVMSVVLSGLFGGISGVVIALFYNLVSGWVGGLQVELEQVELLDDRPKIMPPPDRGQ